MKKKLDLSRIDLQMLAEALEDHSEEGAWWLDPRTGEIDHRSELFAEEDESEHPAERGWIRVEALSSGESYADMEDFVERVRDPRARDLLERAIAGRGAFRRFKDTLFEFPDLRTAWFAFHDARMARRALEWLRDEELLDEATAERAIADHPEPDLPTAAGPFDPEAAARSVASDLRRIYGERLRRVVLFGSWARADAHPDSDVDLAVVLDRVPDPWAELRRMDEVLWRHTLEGGVVISAIPVSEREFERPSTPALIRARAEGRPVA